MTVISEITGSIFLFFFFFIGDFLYLHFNCYPLSHFPSPEIPYPTPIPQLLRGCSYPPPPPNTNPTTGPRASPAIDDKAKRRIFLILRSPMFFWGTLENF